MKNSIALEQTWYFTGTEFQVTGSSYNPHRNFKKISRVSLKVF